jgi:hypothetical protein
MKKIYNTPILTVVNLKMHTSIMQTSLEIKNADATDKAMSREYGNRGGSIWDDDEE